MKAAEDRMRALGLLTPMSTFALDEWEIPRDRVVTNRYRVVLVEPSSQGIKLVEYFGILISNSGQICKQRNKSIFVSLFWYPDFSGSTTKTLFFCLSSLF